jgi:alkanesulfonate monooxygenase SsuD/methylene tetrahydromethanopterin reductase-like flavin-dependent oxidoreductase (luciferase family)
LMLAVLESARASQAGSRHLKAGPMTQFGYTGMCEQTPVRQLVSDLQAAEQAGFDFSVISDHYFPWLEDQGGIPGMRGPCSARRRRPPTGCR